MGADSVTVTVNDVAFNIQLQPDADTNLRGTDLGDIPVPGEGVGTTFKLYFKAVDFPTLSSRSKAP